ncbi:MAG: sugar transferase, partial [Olsenella sp.]|nr:sugar transferase [Olsenella sp.]
MKIRKIGTAALVAGGIAAGVAGAVAKGTRNWEHVTKDGFAPSPERLSRRYLVDRENMQAVWDAKPKAYKTVKRIADVTLSGAALVVLSPVLAATAIAIMVEDGRPVIYAAPREGQDGKPFKMYKFRSMYRDAESKL